VDVLLVDDDRLFLDDLSRLVDWDRLGLRLAGTAVDGRKALAMAAEQRPDIIVTDIVMPVMDGLDFCEQIKRMGLSSKVLLLTSYKDFEYAQRAMELNAAYYLLKHQINKEKLEGMLSAIAADIRHERKDELLIHNHLLKEMYALSIHDPSALGEAAVRLARRFHAAIVLTVRQPYPVLPLDERSDPLPLSAVFAEILLNPAKGLKAIGFWETAFGQRAIAYSAVQENRRSGRLFYETLHEEAVRLVNACGGKERVMAQVCGGPPEGTALIPYVKLIAERGKMAVHCAKDPVIMRSAQEWALRSAETDGRGTPELVPICGSAAEAGGQIRRLFNAIHADSPYSSLVRVVEWLKSELNRLREDHLMPSLEKATDAGTESARWYYVDQLRDWFVEAFHRTVCDPLSPGAGKPLHPKVRQAAAYIRDHIESDLSPDDVASRLNINTVYLSQLFKKETGKTLLDFMIDVRIERAKRLLAEDWKIYEIAGKVGYRSSQYFAQTFRKVAGMTPQEYRQRIREGQRRQGAE